MTVNLQVESINPGSSEVVVAWTCCITATAPQHMVSKTFLQDSLPGDIHFDCSFCGAPGPSLADLRTAAGL